MQEKVFSPSQTSAWSFCPVYRQLKYKDRWVPRAIGKRELAAILGRGVADGLAAYYRRERAAEDCPEIARVTCEKALTELEGLGATVAQWDQAQALATPARAQQAIAKYIALDKKGEALPPDWRVLDVELTLPEHGHARIDLGVDDGEGPCVLDFKCKLSLKAEWRQRELDRYRQSGQLLHYSWAYREHMYLYTNRSNFPLVLPPHFSRYYIGLLVLEPRFSFAVHRFDVTPEDHALWLAQVEKKWRRMAEDDQDGEPLTMADTHADNFGPCEMWAACFEHKFDENLMRREYIQLPKRETK